MEARPDVRPRPHLPPAGLPQRRCNASLDKGAYDPDVAGGLIQTLSEYIVTDQQLTPRKMLEFAGVLSDVDPTGITTYQIEADRRTIQGNAVLVPNIDGDNMEAILAMFRGQATLGAIPEQVFDTTAPDHRRADGHAGADGHDRTG